MYLSYVVVSILLCVSSFVQGHFQNELDVNGWLQLRLWHALNDDPVPVFTERGNLTVGNLRTGIHNGIQNDLLPAEINALKNLAERDGKYRLKASVRSTSGNQITFLTSVPACYLLGSNLHDLITIWLQSTEPIAVSLSSSGPCVTDKLFTTTWITNITIRYPDEGPSPDTSTYLQKLEREREARERGETKDNRSFIMKYWMYIVPGLIFLFLTSAMNPEAAATGGSVVQRQ